MEDFDSLSRFLLPAASIGLVVAFSTSGDVIVVVAGKDVEVDMVAPVVGVVVDVSSAPVASIVVVVSVFRLSSFFSVLDFVSVSALGFLHLIPFFLEYPLLFAPDSFHVSPRSEIALRLFPRLRLLLLPLLPLSFRRSVGTAETPSVSNSAFTLQTVVKRQIQERKMDW